MSRSGRQGQRPAPTDLQTLVDQTADSLTGPVAGRIDSLRTRIDQASGAEKRQLQTELVNLFIGAGHPGRAAVVQQDLAEATGSVDAQRRAADLLYRWMQKVQGQGQRQQVFQVARHAARAYETVAERRPDDLDARTRMGEAYLLTNEPMRGIKAINAVLDEDSTFVPARFQKGLALLQINRLDQATKQFEMVRQYAEDGSPFSQQAERAIKVIKEQRAQSTSGSTTPAPGADR
jgi:tetratricopeptide (TPR) repeat protein